MPVISNILFLRIGPNLKIASEIKPPLCLRWVVPAPWPLLGYPEWEGRNFRTKIMATATKANPQPMATRIPKIGVTLT